jgi:hypothetical protein
MADFTRISTYAINLVGSSYNGFKVIKYLGTTNNNHKLLVLCLLCNSLREMWFSNLSKQRATKNCYCHRQKHDGLKNDFPLLYEKWRYQCRQAYGLCDEWRKSFANFVDFVCRYFGGNKDKAKQSFRMTRQNTKAPFGPDNFKVQD